MRALILIAVLCSCVPHTQLESQLARAQSAFDARDVQTARMSLVDMESQVGLLDDAGRARYRYLRGMVALELGERAEARHWLGMTKASDARAWATLPAEWRARLDESLKELDTAVYDDGYGSLVTSKVSN